MKQNYITFLVGLFLLPTLLTAQTFSVSGKITRHNGDPVPNIEVQCYGTVMTDADGNYEFTDVPNNYSCSVSASGMFDKFEDVTVLDVLVMRRGVLQIENLNQLQLVAADVNNSQTMSVLDIVKVTGLALHKEVNNITSDFDFFNIDFNSSVIDIDVTSDLTDLNFNAVKVADVAISSDYMPAPSNAPSPILTISDEVFQVGDDVEFEVTVEDFSNIKGLQQTFKWDSSILEYQSISTTQDITAELNTDDLASGVLPSVIFTNSSVFADGETLLTLHFKALANLTNPTSVLEFSDELTPRQMVWEDANDEKLYIVNGTYINGESTTGVATPSALETFEIFPNPIENNINVKALLKNVEDYEISIVNLLGQNVYLKNFEQKDLVLNIEFGEFPAGTYFLSLKTADGIQTESFVKK